MVSGLVEEICTLKSSKKFQCEGLFLAYTHYVKRATKSENGSIMQLKLAFVFGNDSLTRDRCNNSKRSRWTKSSCFAACKPRSSICVSVTQLNSMANVEIQRPRRIEK